MIRSLTSFFTLCFSLVLFAQEVESPLPYNSKAIARYEVLRSGQSDMKRSSSALELPFVDDFSQDHFPGNAPGNEIYWTNTSANRSLGFGLEAPSVGVAVFDGLDETGYPYDFSISTSYGPADTLESMEINLEGKQDVVLSFFFQPEGFGEQPDPADSLILDFFQPQEGQWVRQWFQTGSSGTLFQQVQVAVTDDTFLKDGFKMRFRNYATLSGSLDHWMIDWVYLGENRFIGDEVIIDVGFRDPVQTLLTEGYTSIPWKVYRSSAEARTLGEFPIIIRNLNSVGAFVDQVSYDVNYESAPITTVSDPAQPSISANSDLVILQDMNSGTPDFTFPTNVNDTCADFVLEFNFNTNPDIYNDNNHFRHVQRFRDYYAYDDGEPERGYGITNAPGGDVAYRVDFPVLDSIIAMDMFFLPVSIDIEDELFYLTIWAESQGAPGEIVYQDAVPRNPQYNPGEGWVRYALQDTIIPVDQGSYYFGWTQVGSERLNIGNDKNRENNTDRLWFNTGSAWSQSSTSGSLLLRPVSTSLKEELLTSLIEEDKIPVSLWPVPASETLFVDISYSGPLRAVVYDIKGKLVKDVVLGPRGAVNTSDLNAGLYHLVLQSQGNTLNQSSFVVQR